MSFEPFAKFVPRMLVEKNLAGSIRAFTILQAYDTFCEERFGKVVTRGQTVRRGVLHAAVLDAAWGQRIHFFEEELLTHLSQKFPGKVRELRTKVGELGARE